MLEVVNPYDRSVIGSVELDDWATVDSYLETARNLYRDKAGWMQPYEREDILRRAAKIMEERKEHLAFQIANEGGKPLVDARVEVDRAINGMELCISEIGAQAGREIPMGLSSAGNNRLAFTVREPIGPVVAISAFNHPLNLIVHQVAPAVATGCPVIVKPADDTPLSAIEFVSILHEAGLPKGWCRATCCDLEVAEKLVTDPRVAFFTFIGSAKVGWMLRSKLAPGTRCTLEHGGVAPVIIEPGAKRSDVLDSVTKGGYYHSGQVCVSVQRAFVHESIFDEFAEELAERVKALRVGNAIEEDVDCGPLIRPHEVDRVEKWVDEAREAGAKILCGGKRISDTCYEPTIILNPPADSTISTTEVFGPVVCLYTYSELDDAISRANSVEYSFQAAIFTDKIDSGMHTFRNINASAVMVNDHSAFRVDWMPFAGQKQSGLGVGGIPATMHEMTHEKMLVVNS